MLPVPLITALIPLLGDVLDRVIPNEAEAAKAKLDVQMKLLEAAQQQSAMQVEVNKTEASTGNMFIAGWRPFIGWVCGAALAYQYVVSPLGVYVCTLFGYTLPALPPSLDGMLWELIIGMLGLAAMRTGEKLKQK